MSGGAPAARRRARAVAATVMVIAAGLALRGFGPRLGLPFLVTKYGGSLLWGAMVYGLAAALAPGARAGRVALGAACAATLVEASRLVHTPGLDAFRLTATGALLLGRVFSPFDLLAYGAGIGAALALDVASGAPPTLRARRRSGRA